MPKKNFIKHIINAPGRGRTYGLLLRKQTLYPLSYRRFDGYKVLNFI
jgi:hypothetical protein